MDDLFLVRFWLSRELALGTYTLHAFDCLIKCSRRLYVWNNCKRQFVAVVAMALLHFFYGALASNGSSHIIPAVKKGIKNVSRNKARPSCNKNSLAMAGIFDTIKDVLYFSFDGCHIEV